MRRTAAVLLALALLLVGPAAALAVTLPDVEDEVMCITCGTVLNVSEAPSADRERALIRDLIAQGLTKDEIKAELVSEYGPKVLAAPNDKSWVIPIALGVLALLTIGVTVRTWRRTTPVAAEEMLPDLDDEDADRLERDMKAYDR